MAKSKCELVRTGKAKRKGNRASSFIENGKIYYSCYGVSCGKGSTGKSNRNPFFRGENHAKSLRNPA